LILPLLDEESELGSYQNWGGADPGPRYSDAPNTLITSRRFETLTCPSDIPNAPVKDLTSHNYAVNFGNTSFAQDAVLGSGVMEARYAESPFKPGIFVHSDASVQVPTPGGYLVRPQRGIPLWDILDGTSNTLMMAEVLQGEGRDVRGFTWWGEASAFTAYLPPNSPLPDRIDSAAYCQNQPQKNLPCAASTAGDPSMFAARSRHAGGVQTLLCDGSARFISDSIALSVWRAMSTSQGMETIAP
jgi:prepilin-type processing-associated H-X9-DG protein